MGNKESNRPLIQMGSAQLTEETYTFDDIADHGELQRERDDLSKKAKGQADIFTKRPLALIDEKSAKRWIELTDSANGITAIALSLLEKLKDHPEIKTINGQHLAFLISAAGTYLLHNNVERQKSLAEKSNFSHLYNPLAESAQFIISGTYSCKINGVSVKDVMVNPNLSPSSFYKFAVESQLIRMNRTHTKVLQENQTPLASVYPNIAKSHIEDATGCVMALTNTDPERFESLASHFLSHPSNAENQIITAARNMVKRTDRLNQKLISTIFNPNSSEFLPLKETVEDYLDQEDLGLKTTALVRLVGLHDYENIAKAYRKAKELAEQNNQNSPFYNLLQSSIRQYIEDVPQELGVLTKDDLPMFIDLDKTIKDESVPTLGDLRNITVPILNRAPYKGYLFDESDIEEFDLKSIVSPNSIGVAFPKGHPNIFNIYFHYKNQQGESTTLELNFNARKNIFDLKPFIETTDDPEMAELRKAALIASRSVLSQIQRHVDVEFQERQRAKAARATPIPQPTTKKPKEPYIPREKEEKFVPEKPLTAFQEALQTTILPTREEVKNQVLVPAEEETKDLIRSLSPEDQQIVLDGIIKYNETGTGKFKMLRSVGREGQRLYTLRITGTGGGIRALLEETTNGGDLEKGRNFEIIDIDYRKNIYRKRGL